jgi:hypothetical protein
LLAAIPHVAQFANCGAVVCAVAAPLIECNNVVCGHEPRHRGLCFDEGGMFDQWINAINVPIPAWLQWIGLCATLLGTLTAIASALLALYSARRAQSASASAALAAAAARRLGRVTQLGDLILDMQELQAMIRSGDDGFLSRQSATVCVAGSSDSDPKLMLS